MIGRMPRDGAGVGGRLVGLGVGGEMVGTYVGAPTKMGIGDGIGVGLPATGVWVGGGVGSCEGSGVGAAVVTDTMPSSAALRFLKFTDPRPVVGSLRACVCVCVCV